MATRDEQHVRIFVSSPGDVDKEREIAQRVIRRLTAEFAGRIDVSGFFWEYEPKRLTKDFQEQIPPPSNFDVLVCILWSRLGTPLDPIKHKRKDGTPYSSGTEYEVENAVESVRERGVPDILVYINKTDPTIKPRPKNEREQQLRQIDALEEFVDRWTKDAQLGVLRGAFTTYKNLGQFESFLEEHLRKVVVQRLPSGALRSIRVKATWTGESPFRGLSAFDVEHERIFFGRTAAIDEVLTRLRNQAMAWQLAVSDGGSADKLPPPIFVLVTAMSGGGKSSLVRAGVLPLLVRPGVIEAIGLWRRAIIRPGTASASLFETLAHALLVPDALPELAADGTTEKQLAAALRTSAQGVGLLIKGGLSQAAQQLRHDEESRIREWKAESAREGRSEDVTRYETMLQRLAQKEARLVLLVDQLEEIFTETKRISEEDRRLFIEMLSALARSGRVWVIATLRSDFFIRCREVPELMALKDDQGLYDLPAPVPGEIGQMIRLPGQAAGLLFEEDPQTGEHLDEVLRDAALGDPASLPLLEFTLEQLYQQRTDDGLLTFKAYRDLGGIEGAIAKCADAAFAGLSPQGQAAFDQVMRALVNLGEGEKSLPTRRWASLDRLVDAAGRKEMVDRFVAARLFVSDRGEDGTAVVSVAHEALLRSWPRLTAWLSENQEFLRSRARASEEASRWREEKRARDFLLPPGKPLADAEALMAAYRGDLEADLIDYIELSSKRERERRRLRTRAASTLVVIFALVAGIATYKWRDANRERDAVSTTLARSEFLQGIGLFEEGKLADALAYLAQSVRLGRQSAPASLILSLISQHSLPIVVQEFPSGDGIAVFSPDGQRVLTAFSGTAQLWDAATGKPLGEPMKHGGDVLTAVFSADGQRVVTTSEDGTAHVWEAATGTPLGQPINNGWGFDSAVFSPDGQRVLTASENGAAQVWEAATGKPLGEPMEHQALLSAAYSRDGQRVLGVSMDDTAQVWDGTTKIQLGEPPADGEWKGLLYSAIFSPDAQRVLTVNDGAAQLWDTATGKLLTVMKGREEHAPGRERDVTTAVFSPDGQRVLTVSYDGTVRVADAATGKPLGETTKLGEDVGTAVFSPDQQRVLTISSHNTDLQVWDTATGKPIGAPINHGGGIDSAVFSPDAQRVLTVSGDGTSELWEIAVAKPPARVLMHEGPVKSAAFSRDGQRVLTASQDGNAQVWNTSPPKPLTNPIRGAAPFYSAEFSSDGQRVLTTSMHGTAQVWDAATGKPLSKPLGEPLKQQRELVDGTWTLVDIIQPEGGFGFAVFSPDGQQVLTTSPEDGTAQVWDASTGKPLDEPIKHAGAISAAVFSRDGQQVLTISEHGGMPQMWEAATGKPLDTPLAESMKRVSNLESAVFSPDGRRLLTLFKNGAAQVWDTTTGKPLTGSIGRDAPIFSGIFSPDGKQVLTTSLGTSEAQVWDAASGKPLGEPIRHGGGIITGVFSPEGRRVLTASLDGTAQVWDAVTGKPLGQPMKHANRVNSAIFSPDGQHVLTASDDGTVRIWDSYWPSQPPECLADWSEAVGGWRLSDAGALISIDDPVEKLARLRESSAALPPDNPCALVAGWIFPSTASSR